ncbi:MAG: HAD family hydrolase, partial [Steroidobacteraceae bacterium]
MPAPLRLAVWSGPRNVSTACMRSWGNRGDTLVIDEPFYGHYLAATGAPHPGRDEVIAHEECDWRKVAAHLHAPLPSGTRVFYQKHMSHHLLPDMGREWLEGLTHAFLIRNPREMLLSLDQKLDELVLADTGLPQQMEIFESMRRSSNTVPPVIDSRDLLTNPEAVWRK